MYRAVTVAWLFCQDLIPELAGLFENKVLSKIKMLINSKDQQDALSLIVDNLEIQFKPDADSAQKIYINGHDVTNLIRTNEVAQNASYVATIKCVRDHLSKLQRDFGSNGKVVMDGRDIGTVVFPQAELKIYMIASVEIRAQRRKQDLAMRGEQVSLTELSQQIEQRDYLDMNREESPLRKANDAVEINTDNLNIEEVASLIIDMHAKLEQVSRS
jgi:cytidylate kinase